MSSLKTGSKRTWAQLSAFGPSPRRPRGESSLKPTSGDGYCRGRRGRKRHLQVGLNGLEDTLWYVPGQLIEPAPGALHQLVRIGHVRGSPDDSACEVHHVAAGGGMNPLAERRRQSNREADLLSRLTKCGCL